MTSTLRPGFDYGGSTGHSDAIREQQSTPGCSTKRDAEADADAPEDLCCPITGTIFKDPVVTSLGFTYEREAIVAFWNTGAHRDPLTNVDMDNLTLIPNLSIRRLVNDFLEQHPPTVCKSFQAARTVASSPSGAFQQRSKQSEPAHDILKPGQVVSNLAVPVPSAPLLPEGEQMHVRIPGQQATLRNGLPQSEGVTSARAAQRLGIGQGVPLLTAGEETHIGIPDHPATLRGGCPQSNHGTSTHTGQRPDNTPRALRENGVGKLRRRWQACRRRCRRRCYFQHGRLCVQFVTAVVVICLILLGILLWRETLQCGLLLCTDGAE